MPHKKVKSNLNNYVYVKLKESGRIVFLKYWGGDFAQKKLIDDTDKDGYTKFQMHGFIDMFGQHILLGSNPPVEMNVFIEVETETT